MRIHRRRRHGINKKNDAVISYKFNEQIRVPEVRVVDENGEPLGVMRTQAAFDLAIERGFDLVEVSPKAEPPVCKLLDYGQFKYQKEKEMRQQKAHVKKVEVKGIRLSVKMGQNDFDTRLAQAKKFIESGDKLKIEIRLRGREKAHANLGVEKINAFTEALQEHHSLVIEQPPKRSGGTVSAVVAKKT
jgi:translation initiation factor IF-3